jgi:hypothetical protein
MAKILIKKVETDPYINNVSLLLPFNSNFNDNSSNNFSVTAYGNAQISSTQSKFGGSSAYFDGNGDYLLLEDNNAFNFNSNFEDYPSIPFTIEAWIYPLTLSSATASFLISKDTYGSNFSWCIALYSNRIGVYTHDINGDWQFEANATVLTNTWQHVALSMDGTTQRLFLNGQLIGTKNAPITNKSSKITIGCVGWNNPGAFYNGYIDNLRITKGIARYTSIFNPTPNDKLNIKKVIEGSQVSSISGLSLWLKADAGVSLSGSDVTAWADQSGNGFNANGNVTNGVNPTFVSNVKNGKPILRFGNNNAATVLRTAQTTFGNNGEFTIFTVHKYDNTNNTWAELISKGDLATEANSQFAISPRFISSNPSRSSFGVMGYANDTYGWNWLNQEPASTNWSIVCGTQSVTNNSQKYFVNGSLISESASVSAINQLNIRIGIGNGGDDLNPWSANYGGFKGDLAEVIFYNRALNSTERQAVENYLNNKYNIYSSLYVQNGKLRIKTPPPLPLNEIFLRLESDKNITLNGSNVSAWGDLSGGTRNFSQATTNNQPIFFNGGLQFQATQQYFDGNADYMENTNNPSDINNITGPYTFAVVANLNSGLSNFINASSNNLYRRKLACFYYNSGGTNILGTTNGPGDGYGSSISNPPLNIGQKNIIIIRVVSNTEVDYFINNNAKISQNDANLNLNPGITTPTPLYIGAARGFGGNGYNAEGSFGNPVIYSLFLYNKSLTDLEVGSLKSYLNNKHAIY